MEKRKHHRRKMSVTELIYRLYRDTLDTDTIMDLVLLIVASSLVSLTFAYPDKFQSTFEKLIIPIIMFYFSRANNGKGKKDA